MANEPSVRCAGCGNPFLPTRAGQRHCHTRCRVAAHRRLKREQVAAPPTEAPAPQNGRLEWRVKTVDGGATDSTLALYSVTGEGYAVRYVLPKGANGWTIIAARTR